MTGFIVSHSGRVSSVFDNLQITVSLGIAFVSAVRG
jgi:hypothetical protein